MKKIFFSFVILISLVFLWFRADFGSVINQKSENEQQGKQEILRFAIVSDSEGDSENLAKALAGAKANNASFVIGLGDWTQLGMINDLSSAQKVFADSGMEYFVTAGDRDLWDSRDKGNRALANFEAVFGNPTQEIDKNGVKIVLVDNSDIYQGISAGDWDLLKTALNKTSNLTLVMSHKAPYHPQTAHIMGSERESVAKQAQDYINLLEQKKIGGFFSGDIHFYAKFLSRGQSASGGNSQNRIQMNTIGAVNRERNFQGASFAIVRVFDDYTWNSESIDIK